MAVGDEMTEAHGSSLGETSVSPEDVVWADSCLVKDPEGLDNGWNDLKDALLQTLSSQLDSASQEMENTPGCDNMEINFSTESTEDVQNSDKAGIGVTADCEALEPSKSDNFWSRHNLNDVFLPTYYESLNGLGTFNPEDDFVLHSLELDQLADDIDIFKIWNLDIPPEEDELVKLLNNALTESSSVPNSVSDDFNTSNDWKVAPLDDLISGIQDLSF